MLPSPPAGRVAGGEGDAGAGWYANGQGQTMVMIRGPIEFRMGAPLWDPDRIAEATKTWFRYLGKQSA